MLTTIGKNGLIHSRAMIPTSTKGLVFTFIGNNESGKYEDIKKNDQVNVSFSDGSEFISHNLLFFEANFDAATTHWASIAGKATMFNNTNAAEKIKEHYSIDVKAVSLLLLSHLILCLLYSSIQSKLMI